MGTSNSVGINEALYFHSDSLYCIKTTIIYSSDILSLNEWQLSTHLLQPENWDYF